MASSDVEAVADDTGENVAELRPFAHVSQPDFGTAIFRKFNEVPHLSKKFALAYASIGLDVPSNLNNFTKFGHKQSFELVPALATSLKLPWQRAVVSFGAASSHRIDIDEIAEIDDDDLGPISDVVHHTHHGIHVGFDLSVPAYGRLAVLRKPATVELLASSPPFAVAPLGLEDLELGFQVKTSRFSDNAEPTFAGGFACSVPLTRYKLPRVPGIDEDPSFVCKLDSHWEADAMIETPILRRPSFLPGNRDIHVGCLVGHNLQARDSRARWGFYVSYGWLSLAYSNARGVAALGIDLNIGGDRDDAISSEVDVYP